MPYDYMIQARPDGRATCALEQGLQKYEASRLLVCMHS
jgi:hypothetical protein